MRTAPGIKQAVGLFAGMAVAVGLLMSPLLPAAVGAVARGTKPEVSERQKFYSLNDDIMRDPDSYRDAVAALPRDSHDLLLLASSELFAPVPQAPAKFLMEKVSDFDMFLSGRGATQSLTQTIMLAAVEPDLRQRKVALVVSPQWFTPRGVGTQPFTSVFSASALQRVLASDRLSQSLKDRITARVGEFGRAADPGWTHLPAQISSAVSLDMRSHLEVLRSSFERANMVGPYTTAAGAVPVKNIDWDAELRAAGELGEKETKSNEFRIRDDYYERFIKPKLGSAKGSLSSADFSAPSREYDDLALFLDVAKDLGIEVLLISQPMNGLWYDYAGYPAERRALYYERIREVAKQHQVRLLDLSAHEYEPYFFVDGVHLGWKGWLYVIRECADFAFA